MASIYCHWCKNAKIPTVFPLSHAVCSFAEGCLPQRLAVEPRYGELITADGRNQVGSQSDAWHRGTRPLFWWSCLLFPWNTYPYQKHSCLETALSIFARNLHCSKKKKMKNTNVFSLFLLILQNEVRFMWDIYFFIPRDSRCLKPNWPQDVTSVPWKSPGKGIYLVMQNFFLKEERSERAHVVTPTISNKIKSGFAEAAPALSRTIKADLSPSCPWRRGPTYT